MPRVVPFVLAVVFALLAGCAGEIAGVAQAEPLLSTKVVLFNPFPVGDTVPRIVITDDVVGECQSSNMSFGNSNARRCLTDESLVLDPCFVAPIGHDNEALCVSDPTSGEAIKLTITSDRTKRSADADDTSQQPWFIELGDGQKCAMLGGATTTLDGMRMNYACDYGYVYGDPDQRRDVWTVHYQQEGSPNVEMVPVRIAWS